MTVITTVRSRSELFFHTFVTMLQRQLAFESVEPYAPRWLVIFKVANRWCRENIVKKIAHTWLLIAIKAAEGF